MAPSIPKVVALRLAITCLMALGAAAREVPSLNLEKHSLEARLAMGLEVGGGMANCWSALLELKSCTNEIVLFFLNGESYLGLDCCRAIRIITRHCWPSMLTSVGFTAEEGDILRGYCDAGADAPTAPPPPSPPVSPPPASTAARAIPLNKPVV